MKRVFKQWTAVLCAIILMTVAVPFSPAATAATSTLLYEGFESSDALPAGWSAVDADGDGQGWTVATKSGYPSGGNCIFSHSRKIGGSQKVTPDEWLMLPAVTLNGEAQADFALSFQMYTSYMPGSPDWLKVYVSESPITDPTTLTDSQVIADYSFYSGGLYEEYSANLNAYRGKTVYLALHHYHQKSTDTWQLYVDDIMVTAKSPKTYPVNFPDETDAYTITTESGSAQAAAGYDYRFALTANAPYATANGAFTVTANGRELTPVDGTYTIPAVQKKQDVEITYAYPSGDMNGDGKCDMIDAMILYRAVSGGAVLNDVEFATALINADDDVDIMDAMVLYSFASGNRVYLNVNENVSLIWNNAYADTANGFSSAASVQDTTYYFNNRAIRDYAVKPSGGDAKFIFRANGKSRIANVADGYAITLPEEDIYADYSLAGYRSRYETDDMILNVSRESKNPYGNTEKGWNIYLTEWLNRYVASDSFLASNNISRVRATQESTTKLAGYTVLNYDLHIEEDDQIAMPYYHIAVIRKTDEYVKFHLLVMKSAVNRSADMDAIVKSFKEFTAQGAPANHLGTLACEAPEYWNAETAAYYEKLCSQDSTDWGFFSASMVEKSSSNYGSQQSRIRNAYNKLSGQLAYDYEIMPTYTHIGWGNSVNAFPVDMAKEFAGGNGFNGKPVLQMSYQFTTSNNTSLYGYTPTFDIMRGEYDELFRSIARDVKAYGKPVLFRLNNEMNTDWTSYCGIVNLIDPDIFVMTWERMYEIFLEEGVDNCIWIFNPMADTTPYCNWGEDLCYLPDMDYVQAIGLTSYEMGNGEMTSFEQRYRKLYEKNSPHFTEYPWIISEFGCGAGGERQYSYSSNSWQTTTLGRNAVEQAQWVEAMFECFSHRTEPGYEFCDRIKGAVWFSCNDYTSIDDVNYVTNYFELDDGVPLTIAALKKGLAQ